MDTAGKNGYVDFAVASTVPWISSGRRRRGVRAIVTDAAGGGFFRRPRRRSRGAQPEAVLRAHLEHAGVAARDAGASGRSGRCRRRAGRDKHANARDGRGTMALHQSHVSSDRESGRATDADDLPLAIERMRYHPCMTVARWILSAAIATTCAGATLMLPKAVAAVPNGTDSGTTQGCAITVNTTVNSHLPCRRYEYDGGGVFDAGVSITLFGDDGTGFDALVSVGLADPPRIGPLRPAEFVAVVEAGGAWWASSNHGKGYGNIRVTLTEVHKLDASPERYDLHGVIEAHLVAKPTAQGAADLVASF